LGTEIVNFIGLDLVDQTIQMSGVCQVTVMETEMSLSLVRIRVDVIQTISVEIGRPSEDAMHLIALGEQKLGEVGPILPRDS
jgi:hypothetical protein